MGLLIASVLIAACVSFLCSFSEAALLSLTPGQLAEIERHNRRIGAVIRGLKASIKRPIAVILLLNTSAATIGATVAGSQFSVAVGPRWLAVFSIGFTYFMFQFTEILPKTLGVQYSMAAIRIVAVPLSLLVRSLSPIISFFHLVNSPFERLGKRSPENETLQEIAALAGVARVDRLIGEKQERIIQASMSMSKVPASGVMVPVGQITFLSASQNLVDAMLAAHNDPHTRFPIIEGTDRDKVLGYVNFKEIVYRARTNPADPTLRGIIRPIYFIEPDRPCNQVLRAFVDEHVHMAVVRDPTSGKTVGLITLEDLVEELVGEIEDEFDRLPRMCQALSGGVWIVGGGLPVSDLISKTGLQTDFTPEPVSAWLIKRLGGLPRLGQVVELGDKDVTVRRLRRHKVFEVLVTPHGLAPKDLL
jgi:CBS domain containing-hemolysin-like protein